MEATSIIKHNNNASAAGPVRILLVTAVLVSVFLGGFAVSRLTLPTSAGSQNRANAASAIAASDLTSSELNFLIELHGYLKQSYIDQELPSGQDFVAAAAKGMLEALGDRYTSYYTQKEWADLQDSNAGKFEGIGIKLIAGEEFVQIETPIVGSPAVAAGLQALDRIIEVDGQSVRGKNITEVANLIRGEEGTKVKLKVFRPSSNNEISFEVTRQQIRVKSIELKKTAKSGSQLILSRFTEQDMSEFRSLWDGAVSEIISANSDYVVLDLRNNTGGWVSAARYVLEEFLPAGQVILREVDRTGNEIEVKTARAGRLQDKKLIVLVNAGSASASEIVAGALQDLGRAQLIGTATLGKGVEQIVQNTSDGGALFIVYKQWLTPKGKNLSDGDALQPDKVVEFDQQAAKNGKDNQLEAAVNLLAAK
jgi:carboxyl-terminal processing protease